MVVFDNTTLKYASLALGGKLTMGAVEPDNDSVITIYTVAQYDSATTSAFGGGLGTNIDSAEGDHTRTADSHFVANNMKRVETISIPDTGVNLVFHFGPIGLEALFNGWVPEKLRFCVHNGSGQALAASGNELGVLGAKWETAS